MQYLNTSSTCANTSLVIQRTTHVRYAFLFGVILVLLNFFAANTMAKNVAEQSKLSGNETTSSQDANKQSSKNPLLGTTWRFLEFQSMDDAIGTVHADDPALYTMTLKSDGTVSMRVNCNRATGSWTAEPSDNATSGFFRFGPLASTRALCPPPSMDALIVTQSEFIRHYLLRGNKLYLTLMADGGIFVWEPETTKISFSERPAAPEDGGPRNWKVTGVKSGLNLREEPSISASVVTTFAPDIVLDNLGCRHAENRIWCDVQQFGGGPRGYVSAEFLQPAVSPDGSVATGPDDSALRAGQGQFDATGKLPCAHSAGQLLGQCEFGVARAGGGYATVIITHPDGFNRAIYFRMGKPMGANTSQADGYPEFRFTKENDLNLIRIGNERYEIPDAVIFGG